MPVAYQDKPIELLREEVIDQLIMNYGHGEISLEAFERRLDEAYAASDHDLLHALTSDLTLETDQEYTRRKQQQLGVHYATGEPEDVDYLVSIMGGNTRRGAWEVPRELRIVSIMGGNEVDFSEALFGQEEVRVRVFCLMGGVEIRVPEQVSVQSRAVAIMGGVDNACPQDAGAPGPRIVVDGLVLMGGVTIKVKRPLRESWREFANDMRRFFGLAPDDERRA